MANVNIYNMQDSWSNPLTEFNALRMVISDGGSDANSKLFAFCIGGNTDFVVYGRKDGLIFANSIWLGNSSVNCIANNTTLKVGNSTVNAVLNTVALVMSANHTVNATHWHMGNSTVNAFSNSSMLSLVNASERANLEPGALTIGTSVVNTSVIKAGSNVFLGVTGLAIGNSTINVVSNSTVIRFCNTLANTVVSPGSVWHRDVDPTINAVYNTTTLRISNSTGNSFLTALTLGITNSTANAMVTPASILFTSITDSTVNAIYNQLVMRIQNSTVNSFISTGAMGLGNSTVNLAANSSQLTIGANLFIQATQLKVGNSTVNTTVNSSLVFTTGSLRFGTFTANVTAVIVGFIEVQDAAGNTRRLMVCTP